MMKVLLLLSFLSIQSNGLDIRGIKCESDGKNTTLTFFDQYHLYGWEIDFNANRRTKKVEPQAIPRRPLTEPEPEMVKKMQSTAPIVTWVSLKQPNRGICTHYFTVENGTWGDWGYLKWYYSYPDDNLFKLKEMSDSTRYDRNIYFATHLIDSQCNYIVFYYGTNYVQSLGKMRGFIYGFNWNPDGSVALDSLKDLNNRQEFYPRFILIPGVFPDDAREGESIIFYNNLDVAFGSARDALTVIEKRGKDIEVELAYPDVDSNIPYHRDMKIHVDK